jgi:hypothetical protein
VKDAFGQLVDHNEILRSGFVQIGLKDHSFLDLDSERVQDIVTRTQAQIVVKLLFHRNMLVNGIMHFTMDGLGNSC